MSNRGSYLWRPDGRHLVCAPKSQISNLNLPSAMNITILMPVWNRAATLRRAIESTAGQGADQFVIIDDHSTDGSYEIASEYPGITVHRHPEKSTDHLRALEPIIESLQTDYVLGIGADDYLYPGCIAALRRGHLHAQGENPGAIFADFDHVDSQAQLLRTVRYSPVMVHLPPENYRAYIAHKSIRPECGVASLIRHDLLVWLQREGYAASGYLSDVWGYMLAALRAGAVYVPGPYAAFTTRAAEPSFSARGTASPAERERIAREGTAFLNRPAIAPYAQGIKWPV
jgi:glycosyltransferase involved in cell wall biosynthesis